MKNLYYLLAAGPLLLAGCATETKSPYVTGQSQRYVVNVDRINIQDFEQAADGMVQSLIDNWINQGKLTSAAPDQPALLKISRIVNETGTQFDTDLLVKKIRVDLNRTGKVATMLADTEDPLAADQKRASDFFADQKHPRGPDYTLSGKIIEDRARAGNVRQSAFIFQLSLASRDGIAVWEDEKPIVKQGTKPSVGF